MNKLILLQVFLLCSYVLHAQTNYAVLVTDASNGDRVVNALVKHKETNVFDGITNESGSMVIQASPGDVLRVMRDGYTSQEVTLSANKAVSVMLVQKKEKPVLKEVSQPAIFKGNKIRGAIYGLNQETGDIWTNISLNLFKKLNIRVGDSIHYNVFNGKKQVYSYNVPYVQVFANVDKEQPLAFINSFSQLSFAINQGDFSATNKIDSGKAWTVEISARR